MLSVLPSIVLSVAVCSVSGSVAAAEPVAVVDDTGRSWRFERPPTRIVTLAPSLTELVFAAGGGSAIVATSSLSDFPPAALGIPHIGDVTRLDVERIVALKPDLVLVWNRGNTTRELDQLEAAGLRLFRLEPQRLADVALAIERLGAVLGQRVVADQAAERLRSSLTALRDAHVGTSPVRVFYQLWSSPLMTIGGGQLINEVIELCGGRNVFRQLPALAPLVSVESVVVADPEAIFSAVERAEPAAAAPLRRDPNAPAFAIWRRHAGITAVDKGWLFLLAGDVISRQGPRIAEGAAAVCGALDAVRRERGSGRTR